MVDAYRDITIPFQMSSKEFFEEVKSHLKDDGVMTVNLNMRSDKKNSINDYLCDTIASVFPYVYTADCGGNREVFASTKGDVMTKLSDGAAAYDDAELTYFMEQVESALTAYQGGNLILTDDKAPVELLGMQVIDELIAEELKYYKDLFKGKSLSEIIDMLE